QQLLQREQAATATAEARRQWHDAEKQKVAADAAIRIATSARDQRRVEAPEAATARSSWMQVCGQELGLMLDTAMLQRELAVPADDLVAERLRLQLLRDTVTRSEGQLDAAAEEYRKHQETTAPAVSAAGIQQALQDQEPLLRELQGRLQEAVYRLRLDDDVRRKNADVTRQLEQCREAAGPWLKLNELIGSADGKKFSLLAQQVTLDLLLQHANLQLRELASRYRLERLTESLNLAVVDQDLADERRSVHSLSGGETFLASLALALGLASLTSSRVRIESLFIDEGFGSLDEETLEVAMNALAHLQSQGRRVGIITHVERMKDAIPVQIRVQRTTGGASRIVLPQG
ncbi:MAG: SbcC/MukB-like Walker B domain-containing protein, partial [Planctomyces sp.]